MEFHPMPYIAFIDKAIGMATETMHIPKTFRNAPVTHYNGNLVQRLGKQSPEIPIGIGIPQIGFWVSLYRMVQIGKFHRVAEEKHWSVVPYQIPDTFIGVEFQRKTTDVTFCICRTSFSCHGGKSGKHFC